MGSSREEPVMQSFWSSFAVIYSLNKLLKKNKVDGDFKRHDALVTSL